MFCFFNTFFCEARVVFNIFGPVDALRSICPPYCIVHAGLQVNVAVTLVTGDIY